MVREYRQSSPVPELTEEERTDAISRIEIAISDEMYCTQEPSSLNAAEKALSALLERFEIRRRSC
jgi:hypothetical protein